MCCGRIYEQIERGALQEAIVACDRVIQQQPTYMYDALRFKGEFLHQLGRTREAEEVFRAYSKAASCPGPRWGWPWPCVTAGRSTKPNTWPSRSRRTPRNSCRPTIFSLPCTKRRGNLQEAQQGLQRAADASPHNTVRQRLVGDVAARNKDLLAAEKAYGKVIERSKGSSLRTADDFANLSRVLVERGDVAASRKMPPT
jgi:tetratricopeptide (TPR) repeat protein